MDPITAINNSIAALFQFLSTPAGQKIALDIAGANASFAGKIADLIDHIHSQISGTKPTA